MIAKRKKEDTGDDIDLLLFFVSDEDLSRRDREEEKERKEQGKAKSTKVSNRNGLTIKQFTSRTSILCFRFPSRIYQEGRTFAESKKERAEAG